MYPPQSRPHERNLRNTSQWRSGHPVRDCGHGLGAQGGKEITHMGSGTLVQLLEREGGHGWWPGSGVLGFLALCRPDADSTPTWSGWPLFTFPITACPGVCQSSPSLTAVPRAPGFLHDPLPPFHSMALSPKIHFAHISVDASPVSLARPCCLGKLSRAKVIFPSFPRGLNCPLIPGMPRIMSTSPPSSSPSVSLG